MRKWFFKNLLPCRNFGSKNKVTMEKMNFQKFNLKMVWSSIMIVFFCTSLLIYFFILRNHYARYLRIKSKKIKHLYKNFHIFFFLPQPQQWRAYPFAVFSPSFTLSRTYSQLYFFFFFARTEIIASTLDVIHVCVCVLLYKAR